MMADLRWTSTDYLVVRVHKMKACTFQSNLVSPYKMAGRGGEPGNKVDFIEAFLNIFLLTTVYDA